MMTAHTQAYPKDSYETFAYAQSLKSFPPSPAPQTILPLFSPVKPTQSLNNHPRMFSLEEMLSPAKKSKQSMRHLIRFMACKGRILRTKDNQLNITELLIKWRN